MKKIYILLLATLIFTGCSSASTNNIEALSTRTIYIESPLVITNGISKIGLIDPAGELLPIASWEVVETNADELNIELITPGKENIKIEPGATDSKFKYKDLDKYSKLKFNFKTKVMEQKYGQHFTNELYAKLKLELYSDELQNDFGSGENKIEAKSDWIQFELIDYFNGEYVTRYFDKTKVEGLEEKEYNQVIEKVLNQIEKEMIGKLKTDEEFLKLAKQVGNTFNGDETTNKSLGIYEYIIDNFKYDQSKALDNIIVRTEGETTQQRHSIESTLKNKKGICIDFATLYHALAEYHGLEVTTVLGIGGDKPHAWNIVWDNKENKRILVDSTFGIKDPKHNFVITEPNTNKENIQFFKEHLIWNKETKTYTPFRL